MDYTDWSKETCIKTLKIASMQATLTPSDYHFWNQNVLEGTILFFWNQYSNIVRKKLSN